MKQQWKIQDQEIAVNLEKDTEGSYTATIGENTYTVRGTRLGAHHLHAEINGRSVHFAVAQDGPHRYVMLHGVPYLVEDGSVRRRSSDDGAQSELTPPMPGSIARVLVQAGDTVEKGQELLVLSAMKMETTLYAPHDGTIANVLVAEGEQVMPGQQLIEFADSADEA